MPALFPEWSSIESLVIAGRRAPSPSANRHCRVSNASWSCAPPAASAAAIFRVALGSEDLTTFDLRPPVPRHRADAAREAMARIQMPVEERNTVEFLILHQSDLRDVIGGREMDDPATARLLANGRHRRAAAAACTDEYAAITSGSAETELASRLEKLWRGYWATRHELMSSSKRSIQEAPPPARECRIRQRLPPALSARHDLRRRSRTTFACSSSAGRQASPCGLEELRRLPADRWWRATNPSCSHPSPARSRVRLDILKGRGVLECGPVSAWTPFVFADREAGCCGRIGRKSIGTDLDPARGLGKTDPQRLMRARPLPEASKRTKPPSTVRFRRMSNRDAGRNRRRRPGRTAVQLAFIFSSNACKSMCAGRYERHRAIDVFLRSYDGRKMSPGIAAYSEGKTSRRVL